MKKWIGVFGLTTMALTQFSCSSGSESNINNQSVEEAVVETKPSEEVTAIESTTVLNANLATESEFVEAGISDTVIQVIVENRPFLTVLELIQQLGLKEQNYGILQKVFVPMNLNTTAEIEFQLIPGVGKKMAHEFEEYRPYKSIKQFRKEIGKYVSKEEVARYENFVFVPIELNSSSEEDILSLPGVGKKMAHEFLEYRPYKNMTQFRKEIGKYVDEKEIKRLERLVEIKE